MSYYETKEMTNRKTEKEVSKKPKKEINKITLTKCDGKKFSLLEFVNLFFWANAYGYKVTREEK